MGRLSGLTYRRIVKRLKTFGFSFDRQAAGSHEIWYNAKTDRYTTIPQPSRRYAGRNLTGHLKASGH